MRQHEQKGRRGYGQTTSKREKWVSSSDLKFFPLANRAGALETPERELEQQLLSTERPNCELSASEVPTYL